MQLQFLSLCLMVLLSACHTKFINDLPFYEPLSGVIQFKVDVPVGEKITKVEFQIDGQVVAEDSDVQDGFMIDFDTKDLKTGVLLKALAVGTRSDGTTLVLKENMILIKPAP
jgi:hypothetical protein